MPGAMHIAELQLFGFVREASSSQQEAFPPSASVMPNPIAVAFA